MWIVIAPKQYWRSRESDTRGNHISITNNNTLYSKIQSHFVLYIPYSNGILQLQYGTLPCLWQFFKMVKLCRLASFYWGTGKFSLLFLPFSIARNFMITLKFKIIVSKRLKHLVSGTAHIVSGTDSIGDDLQSLAFFKISLSAGWLIGRKIDLRCNSWHIIHCRQAVRSERVLNIFNQSTGQ